MADKGKKADKLVVHSGRIKKDTRSLMEQFIRLLSPGVLRPSKERKSRGVRDCLFLSKTKRLSNVFIFSQTDRFVNLKALVPLRGEELFRFRILKFYPVSTFPQRGSQHIFGEDPIFLSLHLGKDDPIRVMTDSLHRSSKVSHNTSRVVVFRKKKGSDDQYDISHFFLEKIIRKNQVKIDLLEIGPRIEMKLLNKGERFSEKDIPKCSCTEEE